MNDSNEVVAPAGEVSARNKLAEYLTPYVPELPWLESGFLAVAHIEKTLGWRPPHRQIETVEELDALPVGAVVLGHFRWESWHGAVEQIAVRDHDGNWSHPGIHYSFSSERLWANRIYPKVTVLWESGDPR